MKTTRKITYTAVLLALLIVLQWATKSLGQFVTGSCVNCILAVAALVVGWEGGLAIALVSPFMAFLLNIGPKNIAVVPAIAVGNEGRGLTDALLEKCDTKIILPMTPGSESLNAAVAASILMWEMWTQRG